MWNCSAPAASRPRARMPVAGAVAGLVMAGLVMSGCVAAPDSSPTADGAPSAPVAQQIAAFGPAFSGLVADGVGALWWTGAAVSRFDPATGVLRTFTAEDDPAFANQWLMAAPSAQGGIWLLEAGRVRRFDGQRFVVDLATPIEFCQVVEGRDGTLFGAVCGPDGLAPVHRGTEGRWQSLGLDVQQAASRLDVESEGPGGPLGLLAADAEGGLWFQRYGWETALVHWDGAAWAVHTSANGVPVGMGPIAVADGGVVWDASGVGVSRLGPEGWATTPHPGLGWVTSIAAVDGGVWVAGSAQPPGEITGSGAAQPVLAARWDGQRWTRFGPESGLELSASWGDSGVGLAVAGGRVWAAGSQGVFRFDGDGWTRVAKAEAPAYAEQLLVTGPDEAWVRDRGVLWRVKAGTWSQPPHDDLLGAPAVGLAQGPDGALWAATGASLLRFDGSRWREVAGAKALTRVSDDVAGLADIAVAPDGAVWVLAEPGGRLFRVGDGLSVPQAPPPNTQVLQVAADGTVWAGAGGGWGEAPGVSWRGSDGRWTTETPWPKDPAGRDCLDEPLVAPDVVWAVHQCWGVDGELGGTELASFDGASWTVHPDADGDPFGSVSGLAVAADGALVVAAEAGVLVYDDSKWQRALPGEYAAVATGPDGAVWLADAAGVHRLAR
jgi:hypothetical protein